MPTRRAIRSMRASCRPDSSNRARVASTIWRSRSRCATARDFRVAATRQTVTDGLTFVYTDDARSTFRSPPRARRRLCRRRRRSHTAAHPRHRRGLARAPWEPVLDGLARNHHVLAIDLPGHGGSAKGPGDYSLGALASALRDLGGALGLDRATVIGHSLGGGIAMQFAYQYPERCERLVRAGAGVLGPDVGLVLRLATLPGSEFFLSLTAPAARRLVDLAGGAGRLLRLRAARTPSITPARTQRSPSPSRGRRFLGRSAGWSERAEQLVDARDRLYLAEHMPTLIVWGERDGVLPVDHGQAAPRGYSGQPAGDLRGCRSPSPARQPCTFRHGRG